MIRCPKCNSECKDDALYCGNCATPLREDVLKDPFVGRCIDNKYYIVRRIAAGGMGEVYLARQKFVDQEVAIKKLYAAYYQDPEIVRRFMDEARSYGRITHPNAVKLHDLLNVNGQICIVMEYVHGKTLTQYIEAGYTFTMRQIIDIAMQLADALGTVHRAGIIHRDLKTENVMLLETVPGRFSVKILDFGIAKMLDKPVDRRTKEGVLVGTPEFMSPEQCYGENVDHRADIYSYGILLYVMICGHLPFESNSAVGMLHQQVDSPTPPLTRKDSSAIPDGMRSLVERCMMKSPDERYQSFSEVIADLTCLQEGGISSPGEETVKEKPAEETERHDADDDDSETIADTETPFDAPRNSEAYSFVIQDDDDDFEPDDADDDDDDNNGFVIGDVPADISESNLAPAAPKSHGGIIAAVIVLLLAAGGAGAYFLLGSGAETAQVDIPEPIAAETPKTETVPEAAPVLPAAPAVPKEPEKIEPSKAAQRTIIDRGVARAYMDAAQKENYGGRMTETKKLLDAIDKKVLNEADSSRLGTLTEQTTQFELMHKNAKSAKRSMKCGAIQEIIETLPAEAEGFKSYLQKEFSGCNNALSAPPAML